MTASNVLLEALARCEARLAALVVWPNSGSRSITFAGGTGLATGATAVAVCTGA